MKKLVFLFFLFPGCKVFSQDAYIKVHFLYGSKPLAHYKDQEKKWFGGMLGGHVGIEGDSNKVVNFCHTGNFHLFAANKNRHSKYKEHSVNSFYSIFGSDPDSVKKTVIYIPVSSEQKQRFDSITTSYLKQTPYDYALFGMRCSAAAYDILAQLDIFPEYSQSQTSLRIFYPKKLRRRLLKKAVENDWKIIKDEGSCKRKWEQD